MTYEKILIIDTETGNATTDQNGKTSLEDSLTYDIGFMVCDYLGHIYEKHSYTIADIFLDNDIMKTAYFKDKMPKYWEDIKNGKKVLRRFSTVRFIISDIMKQYDIKKVYAFNVRFDMNALGTTQRYLTSSKYRWFFNYGTMPCDIMAYAKQLSKEDDYKQFCIDNGYLTPYGKPQVKAEVVARYLFNEDFTEEHEGLDDCEIEYKILCTLMNKYQLDDRLWK